MSTIKLIVPDIGDFDEVKIIDVLIADGDTIEKNQDLITLESDKAAMDIPASHAGVVKKILVAVGGTVKEGSVIAELELSDVDDISEAPAMDENSRTERSDIIMPEKRFDTEEKIEEKLSSNSVQSNETNGTPVSENSAEKLIHASPSVRKMARELGVDLQQVTGTGNKKRILKKDVQHFVKLRLADSIGSTNASIGESNIPAAPVIDFSQFGETQIQELSRIKKLSSKHLHSCWLNIPHVTQFDEADITDLEAFRQSHNADQSANKQKITPLVFIIKAVVSALKIYPEFNASLSADKNSLIIKKYYHIGIAVDTKEGLVVPVIRHADQKSLTELAQEVAEISQKARDGKLSRSDMQGGSFSISSVGSIGGSYFTPIINAPEAAILGVGRHQTKAVWGGAHFEPRLILPLSVSYDHRVVDGAIGARFTTKLSQTLSDIRKAML